eukprot:PhM_4_TR12018/c0_g1_i1/m.105237/K10395/KIF4_21_27; kinesin family member 4/21/27
MPKRGAPRKKLIGAAEKVHVVVRVRPTIPSEASREVGTTITAPLAVSRRDSTVEDMPFDFVYDSTCSNQTVFDEAVLPTVDSWVQGYHACVFAYGQTGSGKTFTMLGPDGGKAALDGIIPRVVEYALAEIAVEAAQSKRLSSHASEFRLQAMYVELYNDTLRDLLGSSTSVAVRENAEGDVYVDGATLVTVKSPADCVKLIRDGSQRRATGRTNMNEHSSRSHAVFSLHLQHRWRDESCGTNPRAFKMKTSVLNLVDLAGSEYAKKTGNAGDQLKESIAINTGLFCLGNVIAALGGNRDRRVGDHVPYRDSLLTRLLQNSLGGDARTVMIACCSPAAFNREETLGTLRYASGARCISNRPVLRVQELEDVPHPLDDDIADVEEDLDRRTMWVDTELGEVYCRCVGNEADELILFVHGSGPTNSSTWWNGLVWELAVRSQDKAYFMVAIDCPGYGRSPGDRQTIRSVPGAFLRSVVRALGKSQALALVGSSQGACAVFNATLEVPALTRHVVVMDPVGHDVFRYRAIVQPCLLIFDTEDTGHPVKVGRWMRDNLPNNTYHEFAASKEPYWHVDHMAVEMLKLFQGRVQKKASTKAASSAFAKCLVGDDDDGGVSMTRLAGGLCSWAENGGFGEPIKQIESGLLQPPSTVLREIVPDERMLRQLTVSSESTFNGPTVGEVWRPEHDEATGRIYYVCDETLEVVWKRPKHGVIVGEVPPPPTQEETLQLFEDERKGKKKVTEEVESEDQLAERLRSERGETVCLGCDSLLWQPRRWQACRHVVCCRCYLECGRYGKNCIVCGKRTDAREDPEHQAALEQQPSAPQLSAEFESHKQQRERCGRLVLEYGNSASGTAGSAYAVEAFLSAVKYEKGTKCKRTIDPKRVIARVEFNINPDFPKSAVKVTAPGPFKLARTMASAFPCDMFVYFDDKSGIPPVTVPYTIEHSAKLTTRRIVLVLPSDPAKQRVSRSSAELRKLGPVPLCDMLVDGSVEIPL